MHYFQETLQSQTSLKWTLHKTVCQKTRHVSKLQSLVVSNVLTCGMCLTPFHIGLFLVLFYTAPYECNICSAIRYNSASRSGKKVIRYNLYWFVSCVNLVIRYKTLLKLTISLMHWITLLSQKMSLTIVSQLSKCLKFEAV